MTRKSGILAALVLALCLNAHGGEKFQFGVIGDRTGDADQKVFEQVITEMARLHPDFAINVGDLIEGYTGDTSIINAQWDTVLTTLEVLECPVYFVPGNHDIWDDESGSIYEKRTGHKPYYSFDYGNAHFVVLCNAIPEKWEDVEEEQLSWLKEDLAKYEEDDLIFCLFHKPFWFEAIENQEPDLVHEILRSHGVDWVLSGHYHYFCRASWDGVQYVLMGSSGGGKGMNEAAGQIYGYGLVTVEDSGVDVTLIELGNVLPNDALSFEDVQTAKKIESEYVDVDPIEIRDGALAVKQALTVNVENIYDEDFDQPIVWTSSNPAWEIFPPEKIGHFPAKFKTTIHFKVENRDPSLLYPLPQFILTYPTKGWGKCKIEGPLPIQRSVVAAKTEKAPEIDGKLDDQCWSQEHMVGALYGQGGEPTEAEPTEVYLVHDDANIYLGVRCTESEKDKLTTNCKERDSGAILQDDCILVYFDSENQKERIHQLILTPAGQILDQRCTFEGARIERDRKWNGEWKIGLGEEEKVWTVEIGVPFELIEAKVEPGTAWGFNIGRIQPRVNDVATWQPYLSVHPDAYGKLILE